MITTAPNTAIASSANRNVDDRNVSRRSTDAKPHAANGVDQRVGLLTVNLATHATDIDIDDVCAWVEVQVPNMLEQHRAGNNLALIADEIFEQLEFARQKVDALARSIDAPRNQVQFQVADSENGLF